MQICYYYNNKVRPYRFNKCVKHKGKSTVIEKNTMAISLFEHNETTHYAAFSIIKKARKAATVSSIGIGKAFIGFNLCENNLKNLIFSSSEYVFKTRLESVSALTDGY